MKINGRRHANARRNGNRSRTRRGWFVIYRRNQQRTAVYYLSTRYSFYETCNIITHIWYNIIKCYFIPIDYFNDNDVNASSILRLMYSNIIVFLRIPSMKSGKSKSMYAHEDKNNNINLRELSR